MEKTRDHQAERNECDDIESNKSNYSYAMYANHANLNAKETRTKCPP